MSERVHCQKDHNDISAIRAAKRALSWYLRVLDCPVAVAVTRSHEPGAVPRYVSSKAHLGPSSRVHPQPLLPRGELVADHGCRHCQKPSEKGPDALESPRRDP